MSNIEEIIVVEDTEVRLNVPVVPQHCLHQIVRVKSLVSSGEGSGEDDVWRPSHSLIDSTQRLALLQGRLSFRHGWQLRACTQQITGDPRCFELFWTVPDEAAESGLWKEQLTKEMEPLLAELCESTVEPLPSRCTPYWSPSRDGQAGGAGGESVFMRDLITLNEPANTKPFFQLLEGQGGVVERLFVRHGWQLRFSCVGPDTNELPRILNLWELPADSANPRPVMRAAMHDLDYNKLQRFVRRESQLLLAQVNL